MGLRKNLFQASHVSFERLPFSVLPSGQSAWVNAEPAGELVLANPQGATQLDDSFSKAAASIGERRVPKELNDLRNKVKAWRGATILPIGHRVRVNTNPLGHFLLKGAKAACSLSRKPGRYIRRSYGTNSSLSDSPRSCNPCSTSSFWSPMSSIVRGPDWTRKTVSSGVTHLRSDWVLEEVTSVPCVLIP